MLMRFSYTVVSASEFSKMFRFLQLNIDLKQTMIIVSSEIRQHVSLRDLGVMFHDHSSFGVSSLVATF